MNLYTGKPRIYDTKFKKIYYCCKQHSLMDKFSVKYLNSFTNSKLLNRQFDFEPKSRLIFIRILLNSKNSLTFKPKYLS